MPASAVISSVRSSRYKTFSELDHKLPRQARERIRAEAIAEIERGGYGALRKARSLTQAEIADKLQISQPSVAALERRSDLMLSTLAKYIAALGGRLEISAVFPEATFSLGAPGGVLREGFAGEPVKSLRRAATAGARKARRKAA